jgi:hypothetical protein
MLSKLNPVSGARINAPTFQKILDFTSAGSESSVSVNVDGDTDKEYRVSVRDLKSDEGVILKLNSETVYGYQYLYNLAGSIAAGRGTTGYICFTNRLGLMDATVLTPAGFIKTCFFPEMRYTSGTTIGGIILWGQSINITANITTMTFSGESAGNFTAGTRITVFARRA